jgi:hypothetical protein
MPAMLRIALFVIVLGAIVIAQVPSLTPEQKAAGWKLLFDGKSLAGCDILVRVSR